MNQFLNLAQAINASRLALKMHGKRELTDKWQGIDVKDGDLGDFWELLHYDFICPIPNGHKYLQMLTNPNLPWADMHFAERVSGNPTNPGEAYKSWPFYPKVDDSKIRQEKFTHTYQERIWPKGAGEYGGENRKGIRYNYGDLNDVLKLLVSDPRTRQAFLPIWFPEDTGVVHGGRVPCTIGYWFIHRDDKLSVEYTIRACDALRHFNDDVYLAGKLLMWLLYRLREGSSYWNSISPGNLKMNIGSFHVFYKERNLL